MTGTGLHELRIYSKEKQFWLIILIRRHEEEEVIEYIIRYRTSLVRTTISILCESLPVNLPSIVSRDLIKRFGEGQ